MDLSTTIPENDTLVIELEFKGEVLPNDDGTPMWVEVYLPHSEEYRKRRHEQADTLIAKKTEQLTSLEAEELGLDFLAKTTKDWSITFGGTQPEFSVKKAKEIYEKVFWIPERITKKVDAYQAFT